MFTKYNSVYHVNIICSLCFYYVYLVCVYTTTLSFGLKLVILLLNCLKAWTNGISYYTQMKTLNSSKDPSFFPRSREWQACPSTSGEGVIRGNQSPSYSRVFSSAIRGSLLTRHRTDGIIFLLLTN